MKNRVLMVNQHGFSLFQLSITLMVLVSLGVALFASSNRHYAQVQHDKDAIALGVADRQLLYFAAIHGRLPCPDSNADGLENCDAGNAKGTLPYKTIGLLVTGYTPGEVPLRYGVYRKSDTTVISQDALVSLDADLATPGNTNRFEPTSSDNCSYDTNTVNTIETDTGVPVCPQTKLANFIDNAPLFTREGTLDLCQALATVPELTVSTNYTFISSPTGDYYSEAYVLAAAGVNGLFDDLNGSDQVSFNSPATPMTTTYDDQTLARSFTDLSQHLRCEVVMRSLHELADTVTMEDEVKSQQMSMKDQAAQAVQDSIMGTISTGISMSLAIASVSDASEVLAAASTMLATHTVACVATLGLNVVSCVAIGFAASAVANASVALGLAYTSLGLNIVALAWQITAAIEFDKVAQKAGAVNGVATTEAVLNSQKQQLGNAVVTRDNSYLSYSKEDSKKHISLEAANALSVQATEAYNQSIATIDPLLIPPAKPSVTPGLTAISALDAAITSLDTYLAAYAAWNTYQVAADAQNALCIRQPDCATTASIVPYATTYPDINNATWIAWKAAQDLADAKLTTLNLAKTAVINQWNLAVLAGHAWDIDATGGNHAATCTTVPTLLVTETVPTAPYPLEWWPSYTIGDTCTLSSKFQTALDLNRQYLAKSKEASLLATLVDQKFNGWQSAVTMTEQIVCSQHKMGYVVGSGVPPDTRAAVVPVWPVVSTVTTITEVTTNLIDPLTGTELQATVDGNGVPVFSTGSGTHYDWWGSCSAITTGSATLISITSGSRAILNQADKLGVTQ